MKMKIFFAVAAVAAAGAYAAEFTHDDSVLTVREGRFSRKFVATKDGLKTVSMKLGDKEYIEASRAKKANAKMTVVSERAKYGPAGETGLKITVTTPAGAETIWLFDGLTGVIRETARVVEGDPPVPKENTIYNWRIAGHHMKGADALPLVERHQNLFEYEILDRTDLRSEQVFFRNTLLMGRERPIIIHNQAIALESVPAKFGMACLRIGPIPADRPVVRPDFVCLTSPGGYRRFNYFDTVFASVNNGYPIAEILYDGGENGRIKAFRGVQRAIRKYVPGRDGIFLSNTWGDCNRDSRICDEFIRKEIKAGAEIGVDVVQIDDGWESGRSSNSASIAKRSDGAWGDFLARNKDFWKPDPVRFPNGLEPIAKLAKENGVQLGLWYGPSSTKDCEMWETDANNLYSFYKTLGVKYFKIDGLNLSSTLAISRQKKLFESLIEKSGGEMVFDFDVTGDEPRLGYFGIMAPGPIFLENRSYKTGYFPFQTLRSVWSLSKVVDPVRLRVELINPEHAKGNYADTPLSPEHYKADTLFAIVMPCSPLGWFETSELSAKSVAELKPLVARWKLERANMHGGTTLPAGSRPDGFSWTGYVNDAADGKTAYALLFREMNESPSYKLDLASYGISASKAEVIGGRGTAVLAADGSLEATIPENRDFIWVRLEKTAK